MYRVDFDNPKHFHFIGIGGISMSGLAHVLLERGFTVSGSNDVRSEYTDRLELSGAKIYCPQRGDNITDDIDCIVYTAAIREDNVEYISAKNSGIPMLTRAQFLGQLMDNYDKSIAVAGTHGKTTTTAMISQVLLELPEDPTISIGGVFAGINSNIHVGDSDTFITEACEYTNSYHEFYPKYSIILNIEEDHLDFFSGISEIRESFAVFAANTRDSGTIIINGDIEDLHEIVRDVKSRVVTFGSDENSDYYAADITYGASGCAKCTIKRKGRSICKLHLKVPGRHNMQNALAAVAFLTEFGVRPDIIESGLNKFSGAKRRFEYKGTLKGMHIYDDYAHHPTEIEATLRMAHTLDHNRVVCVFQPHTYTRTKALLAEFAEALSLADVVILAKIYPAREEDVYNISSYDLLREIEAKGTTCYCFDTFTEIEQFILKKYMNNDLLITMGAGDIVTVGDDIIGQ